MRSSTTKVAAATVAIAVGLGLAACGATERADRWTGSCPPDHGPSTDHLAVLGLSASERDEDLIDDRLDDLARFAGEAIDCEANLEVLALVDRRVTVLCDHRYETELNTERARDLNVADDRDEAMAAIRSALAPLLAGEPSPGSDPGALFRAAEDRLARIGAEGDLRLLVLSDGITDTPEVSLNRDLAGERVDELAGRVAPPVGLDGRVHVAWSDVGRTADGVGPPGEWLDTVVTIWRTVCADRGAASCSITSS